MKTAHKLGATLLVAALIGTACGRSGNHDLLLGIRAVALDLAFQDEKLAEPVSPKVIIQIIPAPPQLVSGTTDFSDYARPAPPFVNPFPRCGEAPQGASPETFATVAVKAPPQPGEYGRHNKGTFKVTGGPVAVTLPYPFFTTDAVSASTDVTPTDPVNTTFDTGKVFEYSIENRITNTISITTTYHLTKTAIQITKVVTKNGSSTTTFVPNPAVDFVQLDNPGKTWHSAGVDTETNTAMEIEGTVAARVPVDLCGTLIDTFRIELKETMVNLSTGAVSGTTDKPNVYWIATQFGGLIAATEQHTTVQTTDPASGALVTVAYDYTSTLNKVTPG